MDEGQANTMKLLRQLVGRWYGKGIAEFPTIPTSEYRENLEFAANDVQPLLYYNQRTLRRLATGEFVPSHWETGFWRVLSATEVEVLCAQSGGRVEVSRGTLTPTREGFVLRLHSTLVANDARMDKTARKFQLQGNTFQYTLEMSTTAVAELTMHVRAELTRNSEEEGTEWHHS
jgi:THAP4-like, heme-binding beta-barrel domain